MHEIEGIIHMHLFMGVCPPLDEERERETTVTQTPVPLVTHGSFRRLLKHCKKVLVSDRNTEVEQEESRRH